MRNIFIGLLSASFLVFLPAISQAQCASEIVNSVNLSPNTINGDETDLATATVQGCIPEGDTHLVVFISETNISATKTYCYGAGGGFYMGACNFPGSPGNITVSFAVNGYNTGTTVETGTVNVSAFGQTPIQPQLTVNPTGNPYEPSPQDPDICSTCDGNAGSPINVANGNTWIPQQDYFMPGIGGGFTLTRTWNSLWVNMNPPETAGIFGDSWRSNIEERIQILGGNVVKYWKGNGSSLFYSYNGSTYSLTAPLDDQTTLSFNSAMSNWIITEKSGTQKIFNNAGYLISIVDLNGNTTTISVDANNQNRIASVTDMSGNVLTFNYADASNPRLCTSISDAVGTFTQYTYDDPTKRLTQVLYPDGSLFNFQYQDSLSTLIYEITDSMGKMIEVHTYDSLRRGLTSQQANDSKGNPVNKVTISYATPSPQDNYVCDSTGNDCITVQVSNRNQRHYLAKTTGNTNACNTCGFAGTSSFTLNSDGYKTSSTDGNGNNIFYTYDNQGNLTSKTLPDTYTGYYDTWNYTSNSYGEITTVTDPLGSGPGDPSHTTVYGYNTTGNLTSITTPPPDGNTPASVTYFTPNAQGQVTEILDPLNNPTYIFYCTINQNKCPYGLIYYVQDAQGNKTTYTYDGRGNRLSTTDAMNNVTFFQYDLMNRLKLITYPTSPQTTMQIHYDWRGRRDYVIDQDNHKTSYGYDDADRLVTITDAQSPVPGVTTYGYDTENNLTDIWDAKNNHTQFVYYPGKILNTTIFPSNEQETYQFDLDNNLREKLDRNGNSIIYTPDSQNHLQMKTYPDGSYMKYTYDQAARLTEVEDSETSEYNYYDFSYDNMNRIVSATTDYYFLGTGGLTVYYKYDAASNRTSLTDPQNLLPTSYGYDTLNRLQNITLNNAQTPTFVFGYDELSRRNLLTRATGVSTSYGYDQVSRLTSVTHKQGAASFDSVSYTYDGAGNRLTRSSYVNRVATLLTYGYDNIYQLQTVKGTNESYTYDLVGNRLSSLGVSPYVYNSSNELTSTPSGSYGYDNNGNRKGDPGGKQYSWDYENRLTQVILPGAGGTVNFKYDPFGRRAQKSYTHNSTTTTTNYVYDGPNLLETVDQNGTVLARYTDTLNIDEPLEELVSGTTSYYEQDGLGSVTSMTNSAGALAGTYSYDSYGRPGVQGPPNPPPNPFTYTGREFDPETGLYYYRARYYDQNVGRFLSEDPIRFRGGIDFYSYVKNRPATFSDPTGTCMLQMITSPHAHLQECSSIPITDIRCQCACQIAIGDFQGCMKDCKDGCFSSKLDPVAQCQCLCNKAHENGSLNGFETWVCKAFCKSGK